MLYCCYYYYYDCCSSCCCCCCCCCSSCYYCCYCCCSSCCCCFYFIYFYFFFFFFFFFSLSCSSPVYVNLAATVSGHMVWPSTVETFSLCLKILPSEMIIWSILLTRWVFI